MKNIRLIMNLLDCRYMLNNQELLSYNLNKFFYPNINLNYKQRVQISHLSLKFYIQKLKSMLGAILESN